MFNIANHRRQVVLMGSLSGDVLAKYLALRDDDADAVFTFHIHANSGETLGTLLKRTTLRGNIFKGLPKDYGYRFIMS